MGAYAMVVWTHSGDPASSYMIAANPEPLAAGRERPPEWPWIAAELCGGAFGGYHESLRLSPCKYEGDAGCSATHRKGFRLSTRLSPSLGPLFCSILIPQSRAINTWRTLT